MEQLDIWLFADRLCMLSLVDGNLSFRYATDWLLRPEVIALSASLPLQVVFVAVAESSSVAAPIANWRT